MNLIKLVKGFKFGAVGKARGARERIGRADLGVLKVAFMVAALDGEVTEAEHEAFGLMARKCRGYTPEAAAEALDSAMRSAGYLALKSARATEAELVKAFVAEAKAALPDGFAYLSIEDVRRAIVTWVAMGMSDGDYSRRERRCIAAIRRHFAELKAARIEEERERWLALSSEFRQVYAVPDVCDGARVELVSRDFLSRVEELVAQYGDSGEAARELDAMIREGNRT